MSDKPAEHTKEHPMHNSVTVTINAAIFVKLCIRIIHTYSSGTRITFTVKQLTALQHMHATHCSQFPLCYIIYR